jgi:AraC-like DNA-binding protein
VEIERHEASPALRSFLLGPIEGWTQAAGSCARLREVPFPGVPLILGLESSWRIDGPESTAREESFVAGLHEAPTFVQPEDGTWSCIELRLTPVATHRLLGVPMHELANRTIALADLVPEGAQVTEQLRNTASWPARFRLVERFLMRRLAGGCPPAREISWSWEQLRRTSGSTPISVLAEEVGWSHRRLIARFREQVGLAPKTVARVMRFDRAVRAMRTPACELSELAYECGYADQAHMNRDFRVFSGTTPREFRASISSKTGAIVAS